MHNAVVAVGFWGRGLAISRAFARVRKSRGILLTDVPAHVHTMADQEVEYRGNMFLAFFVVALLGVTEQEGLATAAIGALDACVSIEPADAAKLLRLLTPVAKATTAKATIKGLAECMESLGGVGYLENEEMEFNVARLFRDANVLSIWEGTTNIMADDLVRVLKGRDGSAVLGATERWIVARLERWQERRRSVGEMTTFGSSVSKEWTHFRELVSEKEVEELKFEGRDLMERLAWIVITILLVEDWLRDGDLVALEVASRWMLKKTIGKAMDWKKEFAMDREIVFGAPHGEAKL